MAISIDNFRRNLEVDVSKKLVDKIMSKYGNSDFSIIDTNNGNKLREIDLYNEDNKKGFYQILGYLSRKFKYIRPLFYGLSIKIVYLCRQNYNY